MLTVLSIYFCSIFLYAIAVYYRDFKDRDIDTGRLVLIVLVGMIPVFNFIIGLSLLIDMAIQHISKIFVRKYGRLVWKDGKFQFK